MFLIFISDFDRSIDDIRKDGFWNSKQKRCYNIVKTGLDVARRESEIVRFLTLNTSDLQKEKLGYCRKDLNDQFRKLKQRIKRMTPLKMVRDGYISKSDLRRYYSGLKIGSSFSFDYFKVQTNEGNGVLHILFKGCYLPYNYLVDNWMDLHNSWNVNIKKIGNRKKDVDRSASYVISQYVSSQECTFVRSSQSWSWIIRGYVKRFRDFMYWNTRSGESEYLGWGQWKNKKKDLGPGEYKKLLDRWKYKVYRMRNPIIQDCLKLEYN